MLSTLSDSDSRFSALIYGGGSVGMYLASNLWRTGAKIKLHARSNAEALSRHGITLEGFDAEVRAVPPEGLNAPPDASYDFVILATKTTEPVAEFAAYVRGLSGNPAIVVAQNGLAPERAIRNAFPERVIVSCVLFCSIIRTGLARIRLPGSGNMVIGQWPRAEGTSLDGLARGLSGEGVSCQVVRDIRMVRWQKSMWNAAFSLISVIRPDLETRELALDPSLDLLLRQAMDEVRKVASADGVPLPKELIAQFVGKSLGMPKGRTSMAQDALEGRPLEIEGIAGDIVRLARHYGVDTPVLDQLMGDVIKRVQAGCGQYAAD